MSRSFRKTYSEYSVNPLRGFYAGLLREWRKKRRYTLKKMVDEDGLPFWHDINAAPSLFFGDIYGGRKKIFQVFIFIGRGRNLCESIIHQCLIRITIDFTEI